ncbi:MAG: hypothetical protein V1862_02290 [Methanobacteriota archaeon]
MHIGGNPAGTTAILYWGSNKGICNEIGILLSFQVIQPVVLCPFPKESFRVAVETKETSQLTQFVKKIGYKPDDVIL